jgi:hypothetical protein
MKPPQKNRSGGHASRFDISVKGGFDLANPHDVVIISDSKAYVTRYGKNAAPGSRIEDGDDLLMVDPRDGTVGGRIDLSAYASTDALIGRRPPPGPNPPSATSA